MVCLCNLFIGDLIIYIDVLYFCRVDLNVEYVKKFIEVLVIEIFGSFKSFFLVEELIELQSLLFGEGNKDFKNGVNEDDVILEIVESLMIIGRGCVNGVKNWFYQVMVIVDCLFLGVSDVKGIVFLIFIDDYFVSDFFILLEIFGS